MPKHNIYPKPNPDGTNADRRLELNWQRDGSVQLATAKWAGDGEPDPAATYLPTRSGSTSSVNMPPLAWAGEFVELTREQVNHLIKQLRIARDQAFGRDE